MNKCIFAYTAPGVSYPPYVNASLDADSGRLVILARAPARDGREGPTASVTLTPAEAVALARSILAEYAP